MKRIIILFLVKQLMLLGVLFLVLNLNPDRPKNITIEIVSGNTTTHVLELDPPETPEPRQGFAGKKVTWSIRQSAENVESFQINTKHSSENVFEEREPRGNRQSKGIGRIKKHARGIIYDYSIDWVDSDGKPHPYDPKIAIKPGILAPTEVLIYIAYAFFAGLISYLTFRKR